MLNGNRRKTTDENKVVKILGYKPQMDTAKAHN